MSRLFVSVVLCLLTGCSSVHYHVVVPPEPTWEGGFQAKTVIDPYKAHPAEKVEVSVSLKKKW